MNTKFFINLIMNPIRLRIIQYLMIHKTGTTSEIRTALPDVPQASLYRHIKKLFDADCISVAKETTVRGTVEKTYELVQNPLKENPSGKDINDIIFYSLMSLQSSFLSYFEKENADPQKDMLLLQTSTLMLNDQEFVAMLTEMGSVVSKYISLPPDEGRKQRRFTIVSSPDEK